jgi:predicted GNAT family acetyltransferase
MWHMKDELEIAKIIENSFFLLPELSASVKPLTIPGVRGWVSPLVHPMTNRVGPLHADDFERAFRQTQAFFAEQGKGFTWVVGSSLGLSGLKEKMLAAGMAETCEISGMCLLDLAIRPAIVPGVRIEEVDALVMAGMTGMMARLFGVSEEIARILFLETFSPQQKAIRSRVYLASLEKEKRIVAFAHTLYLAHSPIVLLRVAAVETSYRGRGIYKSLVSRRLEDARKDGAQGAIIHAVKGVTAPICAKLGFVNICNLWLYHSI